MAGSDWVAHPDELYEHALFLLGSFWAEGQELRLMRQRFPGVPETELRGAIFRANGARELAAKIMRGDVSQKGAP